MRALDGIERSDAILSSMEKEKKRVFINGRFLTQRVTGIQRYAGETLLALDALLRNGAAPQNVEWTVVAPVGTAFPPLTHIRCEAVGKMTGHLWEQLVLPWVTRAGLLVSFGSTGPVVKRAQVITVHDASVYQVPDAFSWRFKAWYRVMISWIVGRSTLVLAVSEFAGREVVQWFGARPDTVSITAEGWQHLQRTEADLSILQRHGLQGGGFVLAVSSPTPNKNFALLLKAMQRMQDVPLTFVIAGASDPKVFTAVQLQSSERVKWVGYVSDSELKALYQSAMCFVFPSRYEGFGIPPLEAMSCACPVVVSSIDSVIEVCGDAAEYFDPSDDAALEAILRKLAQSDEPTRQRLRSRSLQRSQLFSWRQGAEKNLNAISGLIAAS